MSEEAKKHRGGFPPRVGVRSDVRIAVLATSAERENWKRAAAVRGTTLAAVAREAWDRLASGDEDAAEAIRHAQTHEAIARMAASAPSPLVARKHIGHAEGYWRTAAANLIVWLLS